MIDSGVNIIPEVPIAHTVELGQEAERLGYKKCWAYDEGLATRDVYVTLAAIAQNTSRIELGTGITNPYTRHPAVTAASIASLDELSGGRAFLGIGAGGSLTLDPLGIERRKPLTAVRETMETARALFEGKTVSYEGQTVKLVEAALSYARADLEIWLAGRGPKMLTLGGKLADGVVLDFIHKETLQDHIDLVQSGAAKSGNRPKIAYSTMIITSEAALEQVRPHMTYRLVDSPSRVKNLLNISPTEVEAIRQTMIKGGLAEAGKLIKDEWVTPFVIMGSVAECATELTDLITRYDLNEFLLPVLEFDTALDLMTDVSKVIDAT